MSSQQRLLNAKFGIRTGGERSVKRITDYHRDRVGSALAKIDEAAYPPGAQKIVTLVPRGSLKKVASTQLEHSSGVAGGWYLVREHRRWLIERITQFLTDFIKAGEPRPLRILEAGVAGYVHHYSYLVALMSAMKQANFKGRIEVVIADLVEYPLFQIAAVWGSYKSWIRKSRWQRFLSRKPSFQFRYEIKGSVHKEPEITVDERVLDLLSGFEDELRRVDQQYWLVDLAEEKLEQTDTTGFDLITEHYLTSMSERNLSLINRIRSNYRGLIRDCGWLLVGAGMSSRYEEFLNVHDDWIFDPTETEFHWDLYDLTNEELLDLAQGLNIKIARRNAFAKFTAK